uniref:Peptidase A1 domain-containing protein n=1 Tax=Mycena chlorophos TaxID=658473 RepID=A0ABQ0LM21_MYCCL|nr:predicted protein [Mycena chlorophos]
MPVDDMERSVFEMEKFPWEQSTTHLQRLAGWVERMQVIRPPNEAVEGVFYNPRTRRAEFQTAPNAQRALIPSMCAVMMPDADEPSTSRRSGRRTNWGAPPMSVPRRNFGSKPSLPAGLKARAPVAIFQPTLEGNLSTAAKLAALEQQYPVDGLYYVRMVSPRSPENTGREMSKVNDYQGTNSDVYKGDLYKMPRLLVDTVLVRGTTVRIKRRAKSSSGNRLPESPPRHSRNISTSTTHFPLASNIIGHRCFRVRSDFGITELELYRGPLHLIQRRDQLSDVFSTYSVRSMTFGLAVAATPETVPHVPCALPMAPGSVATTCGIRAFSTKNLQTGFVALQVAPSVNVASVFRPNDEMDGIFGLGLGFDASWEKAVGSKPDASTFTLAFGVDGNHDVAEDSDMQKSWIILGPNNTSPSLEAQFDIIPRRTDWSRSVDSQDPQGCFWVINLTGYSIGDLRSPIRPPVGMILDTGASLSSFPVSMCNSLYNVMGNSVVDSDSGTRYFPVSSPQLDVLPVTLHFEGDINITAPSLRSLVDMRSRLDPDLVPCAFQPGVVQGTSFGLIGNNLFRGLVMEFTYSDSHWATSKGSIRLAERDFSKSVEHRTEVA